MDGCWDTAIEIGVMRLKESSSKLSKQSPLGSLVAVVAFGTLKSLSDSRIVR